jgi:hypothetical protein
MATLTAPLSEAVASPFLRWYEHFREQRERLNDLPWQDSYRLSPVERRAVARSIQQFQLGEWARGRGFVRRAKAHPAFADDRWFVPALELFIAEEQEHSGILGRFLDQQQIPRLNNDLVDGVFRRIRKLAGLEACATVLVTAEILAIPFYQALRDATRSRLLRAICVRILCDESAHLNYQALTIGSIQRSLSARERAMRKFVHVVLFRSTAFLLWRQHRAVFRAAGWDFDRYRGEAERAFAYLRSRIGSDTPEDLRLD